MPPQIGNLNIINGCKVTNSGWISSWPSTTWKHKLVCIAIPTRLPSLTLLSGIHNISFLITTVTVKFICNRFHVRIIP
nr:MAG TPA: hypothetical protein [Caudoviricetes sp.]